MKQFVYVMRSAAGHVKVGRTSNPNQRRACLETGGGFKVELARVFGPFNNASAVEAMSHRALGKYRMLGEWFQCSASSAITAVESVLSAFQDSENSEADTESLEAIAIHLARGLMQPGLDSTALAAHAVENFGRKVNEYNELVKEFSEACELVDFYASELKDTLFLAQQQSNYIAKLEAQISKMKSTQPSLLLN